MHLITGLIFMIIGKIKSVPDLTTFKKLSNLSWQWLPLSLGIVLCTSPIALLALDKPLDGQIIQLLRILATVHTSTTRFTEEKTLSVLDKPLLITGTLRYDAPDHLQKQVTFPQPESYDIRGEQLTIITNEGRRELSLGDYPLLRIFVESLRATLAGEIDTLDRYYLMQFTGTLKEWQLTLLPRDDTVKPYVSQIILRGQHKHLKHLEIYESNGDKSLMTMTPLNEQ